MSKQSESHDPRVGDGLLHLDRRAHHATHVNRHPSALPISPSLRVVPPEPSIQAGVNVALLVEEGFGVESISELVSIPDWNRKWIQPAELDPTTTFFWDLIVIATNGRTIPIAPICAQASRDARQRVLVVSRVRDPQIISDALNAGADDYVIVPFDADECRARMMSLVHRSGVPSRPHSQLLWIEPLSRTIGVGSTYTTLSSREWSLLATLIEADQQPVGADQIETQLWGTIGHQSTLASIVSRLRHRLRAHHLHGIEIITVRGKGYALRYHALDSSLIAAVAIAGICA